MWPAGAVTGSTHADDAIIEWQHVVAAGFHPPAINHGLQTLGLQVCEIVTFGEV